MRRAPPPNNPVVMTMVSTAVPVRLTRSKMARKPDNDVQTMSVPESAATIDSTPTPLTDGYTEAATPPTVVVKGSVHLTCTFLMTIFKVGK